MGIESVIIVVVVIAIILIPVILGYFFWDKIKSGFASATAMLTPECTEKAAGQDFEQLQCTTLKGGPGYYCDVTKCKPLKKDGEECVGGAPDSAAGNDDCEGKFCLVQAGHSTGANVLSEGGKCVSPGKTGWGGTGYGGTKCIMKDRTGKEIGCDPDYYCEGQAGPSCQPRKNEGDTCTAWSDACKSGLTCNGVGKCVKLGVNGSSCSPGTIVADDIKARIGINAAKGCATGFTCTGASVCRPMYNSGEACTGDENCISNKCVNGVCGNSDGSEYKIPDGSCKTTIASCQSGKDYYDSNCTATTRRCGDLSTAPKAPYGTCCWDAAGSNSGTACQYICKDGKFHRDDSNCVGKGSNACDDPGVTLLASGAACTYDQECVSGKCDPVLLTGGFKISGALKKCR